MYVWEDAQYLELLDIDEGTPVAHGETGDMVVTCLYKDMSRLASASTRMTSRMSWTGAARLRSSASPAFRGRSDNMVKLRGINVFPHAIGAIIENRDDLTGEYVCHLNRDDSAKDHMT